ncbi:hypothetical protein CJP74_04545 [Psittacicella melopsittaci]|uniref:Ribonuclease G n=1 Tax=Psittacicella melopsittaci TaxID=2028576 RepID=A0A3A1Y5A6_9GAMM|nr:Rne/Rng family ribonuclease [Psittacicella melopsittaci]RIY32459.1 hypothetical protein CJP74_04545 [Psittacicella melopsittaci]
MKKMLINATQEEEVRIALVENKNLLDLDIEQRRNDNKKSNIYIGKISRIESSLEACFVDYGEGRDGFLPFKDIHESYLSKDGDETKDRIKVGQKLIVQVAREERGNKGAALTTYIALASTFLVLMPNSSDVDGISRRLSPYERDNLRAKLAELDVPPGQGLIVRTAGVGCSTEELRYDLKILHHIWHSITEYAEKHDEVGILHHESETIIRVIRDYLTKDVEEIVVDSQEAFNKVNHYLKLVRPTSRPTLTLFKPEKAKDLGIFSAYGIEAQIDTAFERTVKLKSGGAIVIDTTEALTAIDVNSSRFTQGDDIESTAVYTNLEAADEIARQLKIRDLGGLIVIDFIDMSLSSNQKKVEERMRQATADDRARIQTSRISKFGLMEVSRQRIRGSIAESNNHVCPRCCGTGFIRDNESLSLHILRQIIEEVNKRTGRLEKLHVIVPNEIAAYLLNEKREELSTIQTIHKVEVVVIPDAAMQTPHFEIHRVRRGDQVKDKVSYSLVEHYQEINRATQRKQVAKERAEEKSLPHNLSSVPDAYVPKTFESRLEKADFIQEALEKEAKEKTLFGRIKLFFKNLFSAKKKEEPEVKAEPTPRRKLKQRKSRRAKTVETESQETKAPVEPKVKAEETEKPLSRRQQRKLSRMNKIAEEQAEKNAQKVKGKVLDDGHVTEEVFTSTKERKRKAKKVIEKAKGEINPAQVKAQVEAQEAKERNNAKPEQPAKAQKAVESKEVAEPKVKETKVKEVAQEEVRLREKRKKPLADNIERYVLREDEFVLSKDDLSLWVDQEQKEIAQPECSEVIATDSDAVTFSPKVDNIRQPSTKIQNFINSDTQSLLPENTENFGLEQEAVVEQEVEKKETKEQDKNVAVPIASVPGKIKSDNSSLLESTSKVKESSISKNLRDAVNTTPQLVMPIFAQVNEVPRIDLSETEVKPVEEVVLPEEKPAPVKAENTSSNNGLSDLNNNFKLPQAAYTELVEKNVEAYLNFNSFVFDSLAISNQKQEALKQLIYLYATNDKLNRLAVLVRMLGDKIESTGILFDDQGYSSLEKVFLETGKDFVEPTQFNVSTAYLEIIRLTLLLNSEVIMNFFNDLPKYLKADEQLLDKIKEFLTALFDLREAYLALSSQDQTLINNFTFQFFNGEKVFNQIIELYPRVLIDLCIHTYVEFKYLEHMVNTVPLETSSN